jgi:hypothetical protein
LKWKFWRRRPEPAPTPPPQPDPSTQWPYLTIVMSPAGNIESFCRFPAPSAGQEKAAQYFGMLLFMLNDGQFLPLLQKAAVIGGQQGNEMFSHVALKALDELRSQKAGADALKDLSERPVVDAEDVFGFRKRDDDK